MLEKLKELLKHKKSALYYSKKLGITVDKVKELLIELRTQKEEPMEVSKKIEDNTPWLSEQKIDHNTGDQDFVLKSNRPLQPKEIEELVGADNISTFVDHSWLKSQRDGTWTYSIHTKCRVKDFYTAEELDVKLKEIFKNTSSISAPLTKSKSNKALFIYIGDDHAGLVLENSLYNREYSGSTYALRLLKIAEEVKDLDTFFEEINIIRLGDEMDGYNAKTTRYDHTLDSASNKDQFDIYTIANKLFYTEIFESGLSTNYNLISLSNSNHTGLGFSYIANKALEFWLDVKYPFVKVSQQEKFINTYEFGNHVIGFVHGKDEKYMKSPMPLNLDYKTDLWLMEYYKQFHLENRFISTIKADIHKYNFNQGKSGRYINVPSISSGSNWIEHNFGDSKSGALLEIYTADKEAVMQIPIWFD